MEIENELWPEDEAILAAMEETPVSENEREFFRRMRRKMQSELAPCRELIFSEKDNDDELYMLRDQYDEFIVGSAKNGERWNSQHMMSLKEALSLNLRELGYMDRDLNLLEWMRERDYRGAIFNHNNAYM